jgi:thiamine biosynthesis lipoprotein
LDRAVQAAFGSVERVHELMTFHDPTSELGRLNRTRRGRWLTIDPALAEVLGLAADLYRESGGHFSIAKPVQRQPGPGFELRGHRARRTSLARLDLGGIAKGYAVDRAVEAILNEAPQAAGIVNAGGDLRVFGAAEQRIWARHGSPDEPQVRGTWLRDGAMATSTSGPGGVHVDGLSGKPLRRVRTVVVRAEHCFVADALTKVALFAPLRIVRKVATRYGARVGFLV